MTALCFLSVFCFHGYRTCALGKRRGTEDDINANQKVETVSMWKRKQIAIQDV